MTAMAIGGCHLLLDDPTPRATGGGGATGQGGSGAATSAGGDASGGAGGNGGAGGECDEVGGKGSGTPTQLGVFDAGGKMFHLRTLSGESATVDVSQWPVINEPDAGELYPLGGNWNALGDDGIDSVGVFALGPSFFVLADELGDLPTGRDAIPFGAPMADHYPVAHDWRPGKGADGIGILYTNRDADGNPESWGFFLNDPANPGDANECPLFGPATEVTIPLPFAGHFKGCGEEAEWVGIFLTEQRAVRSCDSIAACGSGLQCNDAPEPVPPEVESSWYPVVGDWDGNGYDDLGFYDPVTCTFHLGRGRRPSAVIDKIVFPAEAACKQGMLPLAGDWGL